MATIKLPQEGSFRGNERKVNGRSGDGESPKDTAAVDAEILSIISAEHSEMQEAMNTDLIITLPDGSHFVQIGDMEIWDGADLVLLRETLVELFHKRRSRHFGVDMGYVKFVPSGFFGMLYDWYEKGVTVKLYNPQPQVIGMRWFRQYFQPEGDGMFTMNANWNPPPNMGDLPSLATVLKAKDEK